MEKGDLAGQTHCHAGEEVTCGRCGKWINSAPKPNKRLSALFSCTGSTKVVFTMSPKPAWTICPLIVCVRKARITPVLQYKK